MDTGGRAARVGLGVGVVFQVEGEFKTINLPTYLLIYLLTYLLTYY